MPVYLNRSAILAFADRKDWSRRDLLAALGISDAGLYQLFARRRAVGGKVLAGLLRLGEDPRNFLILEEGEEEAEASN
jgi:hypothetical protein